VFDFIRRAMPANAPKSLSDEEVYQVTAYVLFLNDIIDEATVLNKESLMEIQMPNKDGFIDLSHLH
jgi:cytochrome c